jgi:hypothetical protein
MNFPTKPGGPKDKQFEFIAADVFLGRFIIELPSANLVFIALEASAFFWVAGEIDGRCNLGAAVFRLFGNADFRVTASGAIRIEVSVKSNPLAFSRRDDTGKLLFFPALPGRTRTTKAARMPVP